MDAYCSSKATANNILGLWRSSRNWKNCLKSLTKVSESTMTSAYHRSSYVAMAAALVLSMNSLVIPEDVLMRGKRNHT